MTNESASPTDPAEPTTASPSPAAMPQRVAPQVPDAATATEDDDPDILDGEDFTNRHDARKIRRENQNLRSRAKAAEDERDALRSVADALRLAEVERLASAGLHDTRDLVEKHALDDFLDEAGLVSPGKVAAAIEVLTSDRQHLAAPPVVTAPPTDRPLESLRAGASPERKPEPTSWHSALGPLVR